MRAMILCAGRGERLRPLTDSCPKPLIPVGGKPLLFWHLEKLRAAGIGEVVVNSAYLSPMIVNALGGGERFGLKIYHSVEAAGGLETAGGIINALPLLTDPFLVLNGDTLIDGDYRQFLSAPGTGERARLYLTANPPHNPRGDFDLKDGRVCRGQAYTFTGAAVYRKSAFDGLSPGVLPLRPCFERWLEEGRLAGKRLEGRWFDAGTAERLEIINGYLRAAGSS